MSGIVGRLFDPRPVQESCFGVIPVNLRHHMRGFHDCGRPIHFTSPARHGGARLVQTSGMDVVADRLYVSAIHASCSPPGVVSALFGEQAIDQLALRARARERTHSENDCA